MQTKNFVLILVLILFVALISFGLGGLVIYTYFQTQPVTVTNINTDYADNINTNTDITDNTNTEANTNTEMINTNAEVTEFGYDTNILTMLDDLELVDPTQYDTPVYYNAGKITDGTYKNYDLILLSAWEMGPAFYPSFFRFAKNDEEIIQLAVQSSYALTPIAENFTVDNETTIAALTFPDYITDSATGYTFKQDPYNNVLFDTAGLELMFTDQTYGKVYTTDNPDTAASHLSGYGFYLEAPDGTTRTYSLQLNFLSTDGLTPQITWNDGTKNQNAYNFADISGCGNTNYISVVSTVTKADLKRVGTTNKGDAIYELTDPNHQLLQSMYNDSYYVSEEEEKASYLDFLANHPMIFWIDAYGRIIKGQNTVYAPMVECGKPVVYLYPETGQNISVKVDIASGVTVSEPAYNSGWSVFAEPSGRLYDYNTKAYYPYLFWEGHSSELYQPGNKGFIVEEKDVPNFLTDKLTQYGLTNQEITDFKDYWQPRLTGSPYFFITFLGTQEMNRLAPLDISPKPDTLLRVFMDYKALTKPITVENYKITATPRTGFTVVEWGGTKK